MRKNIYIILSLFLCVAVLSGCDDDKNGNNDETTVNVKIRELKNVMYTEAECYAEVSGKGIAERGICWSQHPIPTIEDSHASMGSGQGRYDGKLSGLTNATEYYARAYVRTGKQIIYSQQVMFRTFEQGRPIISVMDIAYRSTSAKVELRVMADGGLDVTERGIVYSENPEPEIDDSKLTDGNKGVGTFSINVSGLTIETKYYLRPYAITSAGVTYGNQTEFETIPFGIPVTKLDIISTDISSAELSMQMVDDMEDEISEMGVCYSRAGTPTVADDKAVASGTSNGVYTIKMSDLEEGAAYYVRTYVVNSSGTFYGKEATLVTLSIRPSVKTENYVTYLGWSTTLKGTVIGSGITDGVITETGICWSDTNPTPTKDDSYAAGDNTSGEFTVKTKRENRWKQGKKYYVRAYAENQYGIGYGNVVEIVSRKAVGEFLKIGQAATDAYNSIRFWQARYLNTVIQPADPGTAIQMEWFEKFNDAVMAYGNRRFYGYSFNFNLDTNDNNVMIFAVYYYAADPATTSYYAAANFKMALDADNNIVFSENSTTSAVFSNATGKPTWDGFFTYLKSEPFVVDWETDNSDLNFIMYPVSDPDNHFRYAAHRHTYATVPAW